MRRMLATVASLSSLLLLTACGPSAWEQLADNLREQDRYCASLTDREDRYQCMADVANRRGIAAQTLMGNAALFNTMGQRMHVDPITVPPSPVRQPQPQQCQFIGNQVFCQ